MQPTAHGGSAADPSGARRQNSLLAAHCRLAAFGDACMHPKQPEGRAERLQTYKPLALRPDTRAQMAGTHSDQSARAPSHQGTARGARATRPTRADVPHAQGKGTTSQRPRGCQETCRAVQDLPLCKTTATQASQPLRSLHPASGGLQQPDGPWCQLLTFPGLPGEEQEGTDGSETESMLPAP